jgi:hypothetical protein
MTSLIDSNLFLLGENALKFDSSGLEMTYLKAGID